MKTVTGMGGVGGARELAEMLRQLGRGGLKLSSFHNQRQTMLFWIRFILTFMKPLTFLKNSPCTFGRPISMDRQVR